MTIRLTKSFIKQYAKLRPSIRKKTDRQLKIIKQNFHHPSLNTKKMQGRDEVWEARVDYKHRFTFQIQDDIIILRAIGSHDILKKA